MNSRKRIAIVGAGAGGLAASYLLSKAHDVVLFESSNSLGGHAHAHTLIDEDSTEFQVDTAFLIFNEATYPNFLSFIDALGVRARAIPAEMSSCFSDPCRNLSYTLGNGIAPFLAKPGNFLRPELWQILRDLFAFRKRAVRDLDSGKNLSGVTAGQYLSNYSRVFVEAFVWPLTAAIWSVPSTQMSEYPISSLLNYFENHQLLRGKSRKLWRTFNGSSSVYTKAFAEQFCGEIRLNSRVQSIDRKSGSVSIELIDGFENFDEVVLATHADLSLRLLKNPTQDELLLLSPWRYHDNPVTLHHDVRFLNEDPRSWGSWNMQRLDDLSGDRNQGCYRISYYLNRLQSLKTKRPVILTLGKGNFDPLLVAKTFSYRHPIFNVESVQTQSSLGKLNGQDRIFFCGSYFGYGFHEDAVRSATAVASHFGLYF